MVSEKEVKNWYNERHLSKGESAWRDFESYPIFLDYLNVKSGGKFLDVGCGTGHLLKAADIRGLETYGIDISDEGVKIAQNNSPNSKIVVGSGECLDFPDKFFDYVSCIGALEHFLNIDKSLQEIRRVAKDDALFCIVLPNVNFFLWKIKGRPGTEQQDINEKLLSLKQWKELLYENGFLDCSIEIDKGYFANLQIFKTFNPIKVLRRIVLKLLWVIHPIYFTYQFIFILKKNTNSACL